MEVVNLSLSNKSKACFTFIASKDQDDIYK